MYTIVRCGVHVRYIHVGARGAVLVRYWCGTGAVLVRCGCGTLKVRRRYSYGAVRYVNVLLLPTVA